MLLRRTPNPPLDFNLGANLKRAEKRQDSPNGGYVLPNYEFLPIAHELLQLIRFQKNTY
jgi:hypothetical protein